MKSFLKLEKVGSLKFQISRISFLKCMGLVLDVEGIESSLYIMSVAKQDFSNALSEIYAFFFI